MKEIKIDRNVCYQIVPDNEMKAEIIKRLIIKLINDEIDEKTFLKIVKSLD